MLKKLAIFALCTVASARNILPRESSVEITTLSKSLNATSGTGEVAAAGTLGPFGGIGCGINWAENVSYGANYPLSRTSCTRLQLLTTPQAVSKQAAPRSDSEAVTQSRILRWKSVPEWDSHNLMLVRVWTLWGMRMGLLRWSFRLRRRLSVPSRPRMGCRLWSVVMCERLLLYAIMSKLNTQHPRHSALTIIWQTDFFHDPTLLF